jgi:hypothetical protein
MKCEKCGYSDNGTGDWAHVCGPVKIKESVMNERIKELAEQCYHRYSVHYIDLEKFAELIVRECAEIALTEAQSNGNFDTFNKIVKHFGVDV